MMYLNLAMQSKEKFIFVPICIFFLTIFSVNLSSQVQLSDEEIQGILLDEITLNEIRAMQQVFLYGTEIAAELNNFEQVMNQNTILFLQDEISNQELWEVLDYIELNLFSSVNQYEGLLEIIPPKSESSLDYYLPFYRLLYEIIFDANNYLNRHADLLTKMIESIGIGDIDLYDQYSARSLLLNAEFMGLYAKQAEAGLNMVNKVSVGYMIGLTEATMGRISSEALTLNALMILSELDNRTIRSSLKEVRRLSKILNKYSEEDITKALTPLRNAGKEYPDFISKLSQAESYSLSCFRANKLLGETYISLAKLFEIENIDENYNDLIDPINMRIEIERTYSTESCNKFRLEMEEVQNLAIKILVSD